MTHTSTVQTTAKEVAIILRETVTAQKRAIYGSLL